MIGCPSEHSSPPHGIDVSRANRAVCDVSEESVDVHFIFLCVVAGYAVILNPSLRSSQPDLFCTAAFLSWVALNQPPDSPCYVCRHWLVWSRLSESVPFGFLLECDAHSIAVTWRLVFVAPVCRGRCVVAV